MVYISDVVDGLRRCAKTPRIEGETYIIAGMEPIKLKQLVDMIAQELEIDYPSTRLLRLHSLLSVIWPQSCTDILAFNCPIQTGMNYF